MIALSDIFGNGIEFRKICSMLIFSRIIEYGFSEQNFISSSSGLTKTSSRIHEKHLGTRFISIATDTPW